MQTRHLHSGISGLPEPLNRLVTVAVRAITVQQTDSIIIHALRHAGLRGFPVPVGRNRPIRAATLRSVEIFMREFEHRLFVAVQSLFAQAVLNLLCKQGYSEKN